MPRFYFDIRDGENYISDEVGLEFPSLKSARDNASSSLAEIMKDALPDVVQYEVSVEVRGEGEILFRARITFEATPV